MEMKDKKIEELNKKYKTDGVCSGVGLKGPFLVLMQQLKENYEDIDFLEIEIKKLPNSMQYTVEFFYDDSFSRF